MIDLIHAITHLDAAAVLGALADTAQAAATAPAEAPVAWWELEKHLMNWIHAVGPWAYLVMFSVIFAETGFVIFPFLPGDSFLMLIGMTCANPATNIHWYIVIPLLIVAAILGNLTNYTIGRVLGPKIFRSERQDTIWHRALSKDKIDKANAFFAKHGGKAVTFAQFIPFFRCLVPFVAGLGQMDRRRFATFNCIGAVAWICTFVLIGFLAASFVQQYQSQLMLGMAVVVVVIVLTPVVMFLIKKFKKAPVPATGIAPEQPLS